MIFAWGVEEGAANTNNGIIGFYKCKPRKAKFIK